MYRFLLKPKWIALTLAVIAAMVAMVNLGLWQLRRLDERKTFNRTVSERIAADPVDGAVALADGADGAEWEWRPVIVTGTFVDHQPIEVVNRSVNGEQGRQVLGAIRLGDGRLVVVDRGFVPVTAAIPAAPQGSVKLTARVRRSEARHTGQTADDASAVLTQVRRVDVAVVGPQFGTNVAPVYLQELESVPADAAGLSPMPLPALDDEGPHLSYAIQWFIFTVCAAVGWWFAVRRSATPPKDRPRRGPPPIDEELSAARTPIKP